MKKVFIVKTIYRGSGSITIDHVCASFELALREMNNDLRDYGVATYEFDPNVTTSCLVRVDDNVSIGIIYKNFITE